MTDILPDEQRRFAVEVVRTLRAGGFEAYWAGGCVRDLLLGHAPKDYDVATSARPKEIRALFRKQYVTLAVGAAFGVIVVVGPKGAGQVDVTTFRMEAEYRDSRHPEVVVFSTAKEDVLRRDFTINGMLYDPMEDAVLDYVGGQEDLKRGVVRAIGDPRERLAEDKLRMLRAVRFSARFGFLMEDATRAAIREFAAQITLVSAERIAQELQSMLTHARRREAMEQCRELGILKAVLPETADLDQPVTDSTGDSDETRWSRTLGVLQRLQSPTFPLALAALLHALGPPAAENDATSPPGPRSAVGAGQLAGEICRRLRLSNNVEHRVHWLVRHQAALRDAHAMRWSTLAPLLVTEGINELLALHEAVAETRGIAATDVEHCRAMLQRPAEELNPRELLSGHDLIEHGVPRGRVYARLLGKVRDAQLDGHIASKTEALALVDRLLQEGL